MVSPQLAQVAAGFRPGWQRFSAASLRGFHVYASWLVGITWLRFVVLAVLLVAGMGVLSEIPPFSWTISETVEAIEGHAPPSPPPAPTPPTPSTAPTPPVAGSAPAERKRPLIKIEKSREGSSDSVEISIDEQGVRITPKRAASEAAPGASAAAAPVDEAKVARARAAAERAEELARAAERVAEAEAEAATAGLEAAAANLPEGTARAAIEEARREIKEALRGAREDARGVAEDARAAAEQAREAAQEAHDALVAASGGKSTRKQRITRVRLGDYLPNLALFWVFASAIVKTTYRRQIQAEAQAAQAVETAEAESLKRQVVEARMAAMQAQVEPHFLFNTLASIDHLIEVDPPRASQMQKNLIALLRASMPSLREASDGGVRDLGRELAVIRPYLEILKVRMEERLATELAVPDGLLSAEFPPMMVQTLVENAIKHGLEPKPEGGRLRIAAEIVHGKLAVTVADTGLGFGRAATAGTGVGLANIRERLALLYGHKASVTITETPGGGTTVTIAVPYRPVQAPEGGLA